MALKNGDKLYARHYWSDGTRRWATYTVKLVKKNRIHLKGGYEWTIPIEKIGDVYFTSKKALIKHKIAKLKVNLREVYYEEVQPIKDEIKYLQRKYKETATKPIPPAVKTAGILGVIL